MSHLSPDKKMVALALYPELTERLANIKTVSTRTKGFYH